MARVFITGSTDGLGRAAAQSLMDQGHEVVLHARSEERLSKLATLPPKLWQWSRAISVVPHKHAASPSKSTRSGAWTP